jgi:hypothetical protein
MAGLFLRANPARWPGARACGRIVLADWQQSDMKGPACSLGACFWALRAAGAFAIGAALVKRIGVLWAKRHRKEPDPPSPERKNPESISKTEKPVAELKGERTQRSQRWVFTLKKLLTRKAEPLRSLQQIL